MLTLGKKDLNLVVVSLLPFLLMVDKGPDDDDDDDDASSKLVAGAVAAAAAEKTEIGVEVKRFLSSERREGKKGRKSGRERKWL